MMQEFILQGSDITVGGNLLISIFQIIQKITWQEWLGVGFSMFQVVLAKNNNPLNYLFGILGILLTLYVMAVSKLYAEFGLNIYYLVMSIYGWWYWKNNTNDVQKPISKNTANDWMITIGIIIVTFAIFVLGLKNLTNSDVPFADAAVSAFAWAGMWLMARRKIENWILLNISNLIAIPLLFHKELYLYAFLSVFLFIVACLGYVKWLKIMQNENSKQDEIISQIGNQKM